MTSQAPEESISQMNLKSCRAYMNLNHFFCGSVTLKCQFMPVINLQRPRGTRIRLTDWFIHNVIYGWLSQVISQMNTFLQGLKYHVTNQQVAAFPRRNTMCASQMTNFTLLLSFKSVSFFFLSVSLSLRRQTVSTRERRTLPLVERSGHMPQWYVGTEGVSAGQASWLGWAAVV